MPETLLYVVALAVVVDNRRLLVIETRNGLLQLPGQSMVQEEKLFTENNHLVVKLGLDRNPSQTLYLPGLQLKKRSRKSELSIIRLIHISKPGRFPLPQSRFEPIHKLVEDKRASPVLCAVARWLLLHQLKARRQ